ncbi:MAG: hypothetical protein EOM64_01810 [Erysipelotrichia bacterium]|nr:hypothetical protein [Erysipelotrichia bacterium]
MICFYFKTRPIVHCFILRLNVITLCCLRSSRQSTIF